MKILSALFVTLTFINAMPLAAQEPPNSNPEIASSPSTQNPIADEIVVTGQRTPSNHPGMQAFFKGDYATAEITFERDFLRFKRAITARENASFNAITGQIQFENIANASSSSNVNAISNTPSTLSNNTNISTNDLSNNESSGQSILTDGVINNFDFSFSKYMAGLSQIQLGKFKDAKKSFKTVIHYNSKNYDARLRLGLIHLRDREYEKAATQLEKIDKLRLKCIKAKCDDQMFIDDAALELATEITKIANPK